MKGATRGTCGGWGLRLYFGAAGGEAKEVEALCGNGSRGAGQALKRSKAYERMNLSVTGKGTRRSKNLKVPVKLRQSQGRRGSTNQ